MRCVIAILPALFLFSGCIDRAQCLPADGVCSPLLTLLLFDHSPRYMFVSNTGTNANFGGVTGVDALCAASVPASVPAGTYRGLVMAAARNQSTGWVLLASQEYRRPDGVVVGRTNASRVFAFPLDNPIQTTAVSIFAGITVVDANTWTTGTNCTDWGSNMSTGLIGTSNSTTSTFIANGATSCATSLSVYCVQQ